MSNPDPLAAFIAEARKDVASGDAARSLLANYARALDVIDAMRGVAPAYTTGDDFDEGWNWALKEVRRVARKALEGRE
ncbi:MAG TPA: hypothetical protein VLH56_19480 [Dissulfurispiraceae bacterium]|nr:hypothetical protein [Dissulfurispiraceae bacterium]